MVKHPEQLGFKLGLRIRVGKPARIIEEMPVASTASDVVYVALLAGNRRPLEKGDALKVGQANGSLKSRWGPIVGIFGPNRKLRNNEKEDRRRFLEVANGKEISVWVRPAGKMKIPYAKGLTRSRFSTRGAEEVFLDQYYEPKLGKPLNSRQPRKQTRSSDPN